MNQFSAKLLFQWRPLKKGASPKRRICEERIVTFQAESAEKALEKAKKIGKEGEFEDTRENQIIVFEFIGVLELIDVSTAYEEGEVWSELKEMVSPMERRNKIIPPETDLQALRKKAPEYRGKLKL